MEVTLISVALFLIARRFRKRGHWHICNLYKRALGICVKLRIGGRWPSSAPGHKRGRSQLQRSGKQGAVPDKPIIYVWRSLPALHEARGAFKSSRWSEGFKTRHSPDSVSFTLDAVGESIYHARIRILLHPGGPLPPFAHVKVATSATTKGGSVAD